jgi:hypothetical protein
VGHQLAIIGAGAVNQAIEAGTEDWHSQAKNEGYGGQQPTNAQPKNDGAAFFDNLFFVRPFGIIIAQITSPPDTWRR